MSGRHALYSTARTTKTHLQGLLLTGHVHHPHPCRQPQRQLSFLISNIPSSRPKSQILSRTKRPSSERFLTSSPSRQTTAYRSTTTKSSKRPRLQRSKDHYSSPHGQVEHSFITIGCLTPPPSHRCAHYSTTSGGSNASIIGNGNNGRSSDNNVPGDSYSYPYSDPDFLDFEQCKNPVQLEKSMASYLKSHPEPTDQALVAMLTACANLCQSTISPSQPRKHHQPMRQSKDKRKPRSNKSSTTTTSMAPNLLETILQASMFSSDEVFKIARSIHYNLSTRLHPVSGIIQDLPSRQRISSLQVINAYLNVCAITGHFDDARVALQEMLDSPQGDIKPDLATYHHVLRAAAVNMKQDSQDRTKKASIEESVQEVIEQAAETLSKKARMAFWIKLGLGGLTGATVGKFTMMAVMALPTSRVLEENDVVQSGSSTKTVSTTHMIDALQPTEGVMEFLATQEVATGIGLAVGMLTAGYFILGSTRRPLTLAVVNHQASAAGKSTTATATTTTQAQGPVVDGAVEEEGSGSKTRHTQQHHHQHQLPETLPRARLFGLYFPDLATTSKDETREYLWRSMQS